MVTDGRRSINGRASERDPSGDLHQVLLREVNERILVKPGHAADRGERVVEQTRGYLVVEKVGRAADTAVKLDPRRRPRGTREAPR